MIHFTQQLEEPFEDSLDMLFLVSYLNRPELLEHDEDGDKEEGEGPPSGGTGTGVGRHGMHHFYTPGI